MKNNIGFRNAGGPAFTVSEDLLTDPLLQTPANTPQSKAANGWMSPEVKNQLLSTFLSLGTGFAQNKLGGGAQTPGSNGAGDQPVKGGMSTGAIIGISVAGLAVVGTIIYFVAK